MLNYIFRFIPRRVRSLCIVVYALLPIFANGTTVRMQTSLGDIDIELFDTAAPQTVNNFLHYVASGAYRNTFIHRSVPGFIVQGGGFSWNSTTNQYGGVAQNPPVANEFSASRSNVRGTIAMAKLGSDPNSATSQWFFNLSNNAANLDAQNGGFTVFGKVIGNGMQVVDAIAALARVNAGSPFDNLPVAAPITSGVRKENLVTIDSVVTLADLKAGWNLMGNGTLSSLNVANYFGDADKVITVWKWSPSPGKWAFFAPGIAEPALRDYVSSKGYEMLSSIGAGEGFWVNAKQAANFMLPNANAVTSDSFKSSLPLGWSLIAIGDNKSAAGFNAALSDSATPPTSPAAIPLNLTSLWAWDAAGGVWLFYAPKLEREGALASYIASKAYLDFTATGKNLSPGIGFWVNRP